MSSKIYVDIFIDNNQFSVGESEDKPREALATLSLIEKVVQKQLDYASNTEDKLSELPQDGLYAVLKQKAKLIHDGYMQKAASLSCVRRFFGGVSKKEEAIRTAFNRIVELTAPTMNNQHDDVSNYILSFLGNAESLANMRMVNRKYTELVREEQIEVERAREYGFKGHDVVKATTYLEDFLFDVSCFLNNTPAGHSLKQHIVHKGREHSIDAEATLRKIRHLAKAEGGEAENLQAVLNKKLLTSLQMDSIRFKSCKVLLQLGADVNSKHDGKTPLSVARERRHWDVYDLLLDHSDSAHTNLFT